MKYIEKIKKTDKKTLVTVVGLFLLYFVIQLQFLADPWFGTDELDIMMIGKRIAGGELLYKDICSQHMPFSYYISAIFVKLGARSVSEQRIAFYLFFTILCSIRSNLKFISFTLLYCKRCLTVTCQIRYPFFFTYSLT